MGVEPLLSWEIDEEDPQGRTAVEIVIDSGTYLGGFGGFCGVLFMLILIALYMQIHVFFCV